MGWCSATALFDEIVDNISNLSKLDETEILKIIVEIFREYDWDCEADSRYYNDPEFKDIFKPL